MADRSAMSHWQAVGGASVGLTSARPCTGTTFVIMCCVCCQRWKAKDV